MPKGYLKVKVIDSRLYEWQAWFLTSHPTFSDLLQVQQGLGAAQALFASAGAWKTSNLGALCTEGQCIASQLQVLEEEDENKNEGALS